MDWCGSLVFRLDQTAVPLCQVYVCLKSQDNFLPGNVWKALQEGTMRIMQCLLSGGMKAYSLLAYIWKSLSMEPDIYEIILMAESGTDYKAHTYLNCEVGCSEIVHLIPTIKLPLEIL